MKNRIAWGLATFVAIVLTFGAVSVDLVYDGPRVVLANFTAADDHYCMELSIGTIRAVLARLPRDNGASLEPPFDRQAIADQAAASVYVDCKTAMAERRYLATRPIEAFVARIHYATFRRNAPLGELGPEAESLLALQ